MVWKVQDEFCARFQTVCLLEIWEYLVRFRWQNLTICLLSLYRLVMFIVFKEASIYDNRGQILNFWNDQNYTWSETEVGGLFPNEVTDNISCNESDVDCCLDTLYDTNISLNAKKSVRVKSMSKTSPSKSNFRSSSSARKIKKWYKEFHDSAFFGCQNGLWCFGFVFVLHSHQGMTLGKLAEYMRTFKAIFEVKNTFFWFFFAFLY